MIKQDYLLRMIQEIITLLINALLNRQKIRKESWVEYDDITRQILGVPSENLVDMNAEEIISRYQDDPNQMGKTELAAVTMLKISDEMGDEQLVLEARWTCFVGICTNKRRYVFHSAGSIDCDAERIIS